MAAIGVILDLGEPRGPDYYRLDHFRVALAAQYALWAFGAWQILKYRHKATAHMQRHRPRGGGVEAREDLRAPWDR